MRSNRIKQSIGILLSLVALIINYSPQVAAWRELPKTLHMREGQTHELKLGLPMDVRVEQGGVQVISSSDERLQQANSIRIEANEQGDARLSLSILGFPIREMTLDVAPARVIMPGGQAIGVALMTDGVLVVGTSDLSGVEGGSPARVAGIRPGDTIRSINGVSIKSASHLSELVNQSGGKPITLALQRKDQQQQLSVSPVMDRLDGQYRLGLWVRDSSAGVGTLSFYDPDTHRYGALGHAITDIDTGSNLTVREGRVLFSDVVDIQKGQKGQPGELRGSFLRDQRIIGNITTNNDFGIYGNYDQAPGNALYPGGLPVGSQASVHTGSATILTTLDDRGIKEYAVEITRVNHQTDAAPKSMTIRVTDPELLERTGGIVQGMSGSPIIQDGHIVGAVTHVFVNDPTQGYGLFIEWMLKQADS